jgi:hypothetical protein
MLVDLVSGRLRRVVAGKSSPWAVGAAAERKMKAAMRDQIARERFLRSAIGDIDTPSLPQFRAL